MNGKRPGSNVVEAPPSRYRVIERGGRLIVLDRGVPVQSSVVPAAPASAPAIARSPVSAGRPGIGDPSGASPLAMLEHGARRLAGLFGDRWEPNGRLILRSQGKGKQAGQRTWLSPAQARAYGWGLLGIVVGAILLVPLNILFATLGPAGALLGSVAMSIGFLAAIAGGVTLLLVRLAAIGQRLPGG